MIRRRSLEPMIDSYAAGEYPSIAEALGSLPLPRDRSVVEEILLGRVHDAEGVERDRLAKALDDTGYVGRYLTRITSRNWWRRADAAEKLGLAVARRTIDDLTRALEDEVPEVRFRAARALGQPDRWSTIRIADVLASMGPEVGDELTHSFGKMGPRARAAALDIIAAVGHIQAGPWIRERLIDDDRDVRSRAAHALGAVGDMQAGQPLTVALNDPEWPVRAMAAKALGMILQLPAIPELSAALRDPEWWVRVNAAESLRLMGPEGLQALEAMLGDTDTYARHQAVFMLQESGVVDERVDQLFDASPETSTEARTFIRSILRTGQHGHLSELAASHNDPQIRKLLSQMLGLEEPHTEAPA